MCCGFLFTEVIFLLLYVLTAPALSLSSGPHFLLHLYGIYSGYTFLGVALGSLSPFLREVIQVCVCGIALVCYPLSLIPAPLLSCLSTALLVVSPLLSLLEGYALFLLITRTSRFFTARLQEDDEDGLAKGTILALSAVSLAVAGYLNVYYIDLPPSTKVLLFGGAMLLLVLNIVLEEGIVSDACLLILANYVVLCAALTSSSHVSPALPQFSTSGAAQSQTMLGAIVRIPHLVSYSVGSVVPYVKQLLAPLPLCLLAVRVISMAGLSDMYLSEESWVRGLGKFFIVTIYTSYVLGATNTSPTLALFGGVCRAAEVVIMMGAYLKYLLWHDHFLDDSF